MPRRGEGYRPDEDAVIRELYPVGGARAVADRIGRSECSVQARASRLGVRTAKSRRERWTEEQERYCLSRLISMSRVTGHTPLSVIRHLETIVRRRLMET